MNIKRNKRLISLILGVLVWQLLMPMTAFGTNTWPMTMRDYSLEIYEDFDSFSINDNTLRVLFDSDVYSDASMTSGSRKDTDSFEYTDPKTGATFVIPENWTQEPLSKEREIVNAKFVSNEDAVQMILYGSIDLWNGMSASERQGYTRADIDNSAVSVADIAELMGVRPSDVTIVTYNGKEYFKTVEINEGEVLGISITVTMTNLVRLEYGNYYLFQTNMQETSSKYKDFETLVSSMKYPSFYDQETNAAIKSEADKEGKTASGGSAPRKEGDYGKESSLWATSSWLILILLDLLITVVIHPVPLWIYRYAIRKQPVAPKQAKRIVIIDAIIVFIVWLAIMALKNGSRLSFVALLVWSRICYSSLTKGYSSSQDYHIKLKSCLVSDMDGITETFQHNGKDYDRQQYIELEREALLSLDVKTLTEGYIKLRDENENHTLSGLKAANLEAYKLAILEHPDCQGTAIYRGLKKEAEQKEAERFDQFKELETRFETTKNNGSSERPRIRFCRRCGFELIDGSTVCTQCGTPVIKER